MAEKILSNIFGNDLDDLVEASDLSDGYVPFVSETAFADSPLRINGGKVGIGTSPSKTLHVAASVSGDWVAKFYNSDTTGAYGVVINAGDGDGGKILALQDRSGDEKFSVRDTGDLLFGTTIGPTGTHERVIILGDNTGDPTPGTNTAAFYAKDVAGTVETFTADEAGNVTQLSDHASGWPEELEVSETYPQVKTDENKFLGIKRYIALGRMAELVEELSHKAGLLPAEKKLVVYETTGEKLDWDSVQAEHVQNREKEVQAAEKSKAEIEKQITEVDAGLSVLTKQFSELKSTEPVNVPGGDTILAEQIARLKQKIVEAEKVKEDLERQLADHVIPEPLTVKSMPKWIADRLKTE